MPDVLMPDLWICSECMMWAQGYEVLDSDGEDAADAHTARVESQWDGWRDAATGRFPQIMLEFGDDDPDVHFRTSPCDGCGSEPAGDRYPALLFG